jgi:coiled-coil-helix-coiled-coil-helix domain-containing protein 2
MIAQMAATAGSVAIGSTIGHGISSMLFGGGGSTAAETQAPPPPVQQQTHQQTGGISCEIQAKGIIGHVKYPFII